MKTFLSGLIIGALGFWIVAGRVTGPVHFEQSSLKAEPTQEEPSIVTSSPAKTPIEKKVEDFVQNSKPVMGVASSERSPVLESVPFAVPFEGSDVSPEIRKTLKQAVDLVQDNRPQEAMKQIEDALASHPDDPYLLTQAAHLNGSVIRNFEKEKAYIRELHRKHPELPIANSAMGDLLVRENDFESAGPYLKKAVELAEQPAPDALTAVAVNHMRLKQSDEAEPYFKRAAGLLRVQIENARASGEDTTLYRQQLAFKQLDLAYHQMTAGKHEESARLLSEIEPVLGPNSEEVKRLRADLGRGPQSASDSELN